MRWGWRSSSWSGSAVRKRKPDRAPTFSSRRRCRAMPHRGAVVFAWRVAKRGRGGTEASGNPPQRWQLVELLAAALGRWGGRDARSLLGGDGGDGLGWSAGSRRRGDGSLDCRGRLHWRGCPSGFLPPRRRVNRDRRWAPPGRDGLRDATTRSLGFARRDRGGGRRGCLGEQR